MKICQKVEDGDTASEKEETCAEVEAVGDESGGSEGDVVSVSGKEEES